MNNHDTADEDDIELDNLLTTPFIDLCLNTLFIFIILFNPEQKVNDEEKRIETSGEFLIQVTWDDQSNDDVDTHVRDSQDNHLFYNKREAGLMHLERDDRGRFNDTNGADENNMPIEVTKNEERAIIRGIVPGEYIVNIHLYRKVDKTATKVRIVLIKLRGQDTIITEKELTFPIEAEEKTAFRFTLNAAGEVTDINYLPRKFIGQPGQPLEGDPENPDQNPENPR